MNRNDFYQLIKPLTNKLYRAAYGLMSDDLQAEQLVIDALNGYLVKERQQILKSRSLEELNKKDLQLQKRHHFKNILRYMCDIGIRRSAQLGEQVKAQSPKDFQSFIKLEAKVRFTLCLRYDFQFTADEIEDITGMTRYEVIEKLHNGRFLLMNDFNAGAQV